MEVAKRLLGYDLGLAIRNMDIPMDIPGLGTYIF